MRLPRLYLGTMTFAWNQASAPVDDRVALQFLERFASAGGRHVDTARIYAAGETEPMLGRALRSCRSCVSADLLVGSKAAPSQPGGLTAAGMRKQLDASLAAIGVESLAEYYLHQPDTEAALLESLREAHTMVQEGRVCAVGMSNYHASEVARAFALCAEHGLTKPSVYQGLYNPLNRAVELELLPLLREHGCSFVAFNPLAAGLLSGAHKRGGDVPAGRFKNNPNYLPRFYTPPNFDALAAIEAACGEAGLPLLQATFCWLLRHSALAETDGLLIGASSLAHLEANLEACEMAKAAELPPPVRAAFDAAWELTRGSAFCYWRSYSADMPGREGLDQGASYTAHGPK
mmetsp:Transcript_1886/g.5928  ORF Transcript_1886/g.5928 Transcript_1886/m.5928 type:complete len:347 (+) Transcript_1886:97-1137(+)